jgi:5S rRNA maturation endonuclease (ribonuclease M5)
VKPSASRASFLLEASKVFSGQFEASPAAEYLEQHRGITTDTAKMMGLGYVADSAFSGFEMYRGMIAVPYLRYAYDGSPAVAQLRFRCVRPGCVKDDDGNFLEKEVHVGHGKMNTMPGDHMHIYNTSDLAKYTEEIAICEGEPDTWTTKQCGIPVVGIQGANGWMPHFTELFDGYKIVWILADGDEAGMKFATSVAEQIPVARIIPMEETLDVNKSVRMYGEDFLREKVGM